MPIFHPRLLWIAAVLAASGAQAATMHKCTLNGSVSYQQTPCPASHARQDPTLEELNAAEKKRRTTAAQATPDASVANRERLAGPPATPSSHRCDGRKHCAQMGSCAEAKFFLAHCPGVKMDGDNDGIPCEEQWCSP